jgi:hypothetical protein
MRSVGHGSCLIVFTGFIQYCNVPFFPFQRLFCRCYKSDAAQKEKEKVPEGVN